MNKTDKFIVKAKNVHGDTYDYSKVEYINATTNVIITCKEHGDFEQWPTVHLRGSGCRKCADKRISKANSGPSKKRLTTEIFIERAKKIHGNKYDYSKVVYKTAHDKVEIICPTHRSFWQKPYGHINSGYGCKKCSNDQNGKRSRKTTKEYILEAQQIHGEKYDYRDVEYKTAHDKIKIICPTHGTFEQYANDHLKGSGCPKCGNETSASKLRGKLGYETFDFVKKAREIHGEKYQYGEYKGSTRHITITCPVHGNFEQLASNHLNGNGCPKCVDTTLPFIDFEKRANETHNSKYDYVEYTKVSSKVGIVCPEHGLFYQNGNDHLHGSGCPYCSKEKIKNLLRKKPHDFIKIANEKFGHFEYDISSYVDLTTPIKIICPIHGEFHQTPEIHLSSKHGCPRCAERISAELRTLSQDDFIERARNIHGNTYQYGEYAKSNEKMEIICPRHGIFHQQPNNHLSGYGCPKCGKNYIKQHKWLDKMGVPDNPNTREVQIKIDDKTFVVDGFDPNTNTIYEFWGDFWHGNPKVFDPSGINRVNGKTFADLFEKTQQKRKKITNAGYKLIEIWEYDWDRI